MTQRKINTSVRILPVLVASLSVLALPALASAQEVYLSETDKATIMEACSNGTAPLQVADDFGGTTGEYIVPVYDKWGDPIRAIPVKGSLLRTLKVCQTAVKAADPSEPVFEIFASIDHQSTTLE
ncbi:MAG: hypothetical protein AAGH90_04995 [Pseudomonadota bacterium]